MPRWGGLLLLGSMTAWAGVVVFRNGAKVETSLMALLPQQERDPMAQKSNAQISERGNRVLSLALIHPDGGMAAEAGAYVEETLKSFPWVGSHLMGPTEESFDEIQDYYFPRRFHLLSDRDRELVQKPEVSEEWVNRLTSFLASPLSTSMLGLIQRDPFQLFSTYFSDVLADNLSGSLNGTERRDGGPFFLSVELNGDAFDSSFQDTVQSSLGALSTEVQRLYPGTRFVYSGVLTFARDQRVQAERDLVWLSVFSLLGTVSLLAWGFRHGTMILLSVGAVGVAIIVAWIVTSAVFGSVHVMTLSLGTTLIGCAIDYPIHFLCHSSSAHAPPWEIRVKGASGPAIFKKVRPGLFMGLITSLVGFSLMGFSHLPALKQVAIFCSVGLATTFAMVWILSGWDRFALSSVKDPPGIWKEAWSTVRTVIQIGDKKKSVPIMLAFTTFMGGVLAMGLSRVQFNDDVRLLQRPSLRIMEDARVIHHAGGVGGIRYLLTESRDQQSLLERLEEVESRLRKMEKTNVVRSFTSLAPFIPSLNRQKENLRRVRELFQTRRKYFTDQLREVGFSFSSIQTIFKEIEINGNEVTVSSWLPHRCSRALKSFWLGEIGGKWGALTWVGDIVSPKDFQAGLEGLEGTRLIDPLRDYSDLLSRYRRHSLILLSVSFGIVFVLLWVRYGGVGALFALLPPLGGVITVFATYGFFQTPVTIFHALAILLVFSLGVDYSVYFSECRSSSSLEGPTFLSVFLSATSTLISFGLLMACHFPPLKALGQVTFFGLLFSFLFSPLPWVLRREGAP